MHLNPMKCVLDVEVGKFLKFMLTVQGIEATIDKCGITLRIRGLFTIYVPAKLS